MFKYIIITALAINFAYASLPVAISDFIAKDKIDSNNLSVVIKDEISGTVLASINPTLPRTPASVEKIATTYAALLEFGKNFKWPTQIFYTGNLKQGTLNGDLIVKAFGDPTLKASDVKSFAQKISGYGIRKISGNLVIDRSFFKNSPKISSGFDKNYVSEYNAMPDALMYNDHLDAIKIYPKNNKIYAERLYGDRGFKLINKVQAVNGSCRGVRAWPSIKFLKDKSSVSVVLGGTLSVKCHPVIIRKVLSRSYVNFYYSFLHYLKAEGVSFNGNLVLKSTPKSAKLLFTHYSKPLIEIVSKTLKMSNNLYARHIFLILGAKRYGYPATLRKSQLAIRYILGSRGVLSREDFVSNGCGLSREAKMKPTTAIKIMSDAYKTYGQEWLNALSIAGVDGTINKRFRYTIVKNRAFMKTGTLKRAKNIAGFVKTKSGRLLNVAIFYNGAKIWLGRDVQNRIITWLVNQ